MKLKREIANRKDFEKEFVAHFRRLLRIGEDEATVDVEFAEEIPIESSGKLRKVISELDRDG